MVGENNSSGHRHRRLGAFGCLIAGLLLSACGIPESMDVRAGIDPRNRDDNVRFRTTYYFRVFDLCMNADGTTVNKGPQLDSLYRFRMTGKASSLFSKVRFEAGTLHKSEIDPFGAAIEYDDQLGRFKFTSQQATEEKVNREANYAELDRRLKILREINSAIPVNQDAELSESEKQSAKAVREAITQSITRLVGQFSPAPGQDSTAQRTRPKTTPTPANCEGVSKLRRGFQVFGPEGVRTFNPDERLLMAMSSSGKPLISALKELSGRVLNEQPSASESLLPLVRERLAVSEGERALDAFERSPPDTPEKLAAEDVVQKLRDAMAANE